MSKLITLKIEQSLLEKIRKIAKKKFPHRSIEFYAEATREILIDVVRKNKKILNQGIQNQTSSQEAF